jgi:hypothetical protein
MAAAITIMMQPIVMGVLRPYLSLRKGTTGRETMEPIEYMALRRPKVSSEGLSIVVFQESRS